MINVNKKHEEWDKLWNAIKDIAEVLNIRKSDLVPNKKEVEEQKSMNISVDTYSHGGYYGTVSIKDFIQK
ncbi:MAG TPA: hypothetical protein ENF43_04065 [Thermoplasmatales archaeon]|nr:hypothetical protein [Thermoplasmatales archaeon]